MGYITKTIAEPTKVVSLNGIVINKIVCGDNYSSCITTNGQLLVCGELDGGKLGLGKAWSSGFIMSFKEVLGLQNVKKVSCGPNHMLAISKTNSKS